MAGGLTAAHDIRRVTRLPVDRDGRRMKGVAIVGGDRMKMGQTRLSIIES